MPSVHDMQMLDFWLEPLGGVFCLKVSIGYLVHVTKSLVKFVKSKSKPETKYLPFISDFPYLMLMNFSISELQLKTNIKLIILKFNSSIS